MGGREKYLELWANLKEKNRVVLVAWLVSLLLNIVLASALAYISINGKQPVEMPGVGVVSYGDKAYMEGMGRKIVGFLADFNYENINDRASLLSSYIKEPEVSDRILKDNDFIAKNRVTQAFSPYENTWKTEKPAGSKTVQVSVEGRLMRIMGRDIVDNGKYKYTVFIKANGHSVDLEEWKFEPKM